MGADVAIVLARGGCRVTVVDPNEAKRAPLHGPCTRRLGTARAWCARAEQRTGGRHAATRCIGTTLRWWSNASPKNWRSSRHCLQNWYNCAPATHRAGQQQLQLPDQRHRAGPGHAGSACWGCTFSCRRIWCRWWRWCWGRDTDPAQAERLCSFMRGCGSVPVLVRKDKPGFLANRLQHALAREAFAMIDEGIASAEDVDAAVRFGFGFRYLAAGPVLQRDHAGLDVHCAAAATMYPSLSNAATAGPACCKTTSTRGRAGHEDRRRFLRLARRPPPGRTGALRPAAAAGAGPAGRRTSTADTVDRRLYT